MKIEVNVSKGRFFAIIFSILILTTVIGVYAYNANGHGGNPTVFGHSADELEVILPNGTVTTLQNAIYSNLILNNITQITNQVTNQIINEAGGKNKSVLIDIPVYLINLASFPATGDFPTAINLNSYASQYSPGRKPTAARVMLEAYVQGISGYIGVSLQSSPKWAGLPLKGIRASSNENIKAEYVIPIDSSGNIYYTWICGISAGCFGQDSSKLYAAIYLTGFEYDSSNVFNNWNV